MEASSIRPDLRRDQKENGYVTWRVSDWCRPDTEAAEFTAWDCQPTHRHSELHDRATLSIRSGACSMQLNMTHEEWSILSRIAAEKAESIRFVEAA